MKSYQRFTVAPCTLTLNKDGACTGAITLGGKTTQISGRWIWSASRKKLVIPNSTVPSLVFAGEDHLVGIDIGRKILVVVERR